MNNTFSSRDDNYPIEITAQGIEQTENRFLLSKICNLSQ